MVIGWPGESPLSKRTPGPRGSAQQGDLAGGRRVTALRVLGADPALDRVASRNDVRLAKAQALAVRHADLLGDEVEPGDHLGDGMLDLQARIHLEEVELS